MSTDWPTCDPPQERQALQDPVKVARPLNKDLSDNSKELVHPSNLSRRKDNDSANLCKYAAQTYSYPHDPVHDLVMENLQKSLNEYLFYEFDVDGDESMISETWPFKLRHVGEAPELSFFEFDDDDDAFFAFAKPALDFMPKASMTTSAWLRLSGGVGRWLQEGSRT